MPATKRIRFWGMNNDYDANYPTHEQAEMLARRFAKLGMNILRITHTDQQYAPMGLFDPAFKGEMRIDPAQMEKLDYFIAELKKRGIYVELSLHIGHLKLMGEKGNTGCWRQTLQFRVRLALMERTLHRGGEAICAGLLGPCQPVHGQALYRGARGGLCGNRQREWDSSAPGPAVI